jgi:hypothetical protein
MLGRLVVWLGVGLGTTACFVPFLTRRYSEWESVYVPAAQRLLLGQPLYLDHDPYLYPPFAAIVALPWTVMPAWFGRLVWLALNAGCVWLILRLGWKIAGGSRDDSSWHGGWAWTIGLGCGALALQNALAHQQTDVLLAAWQIAGLWLLMQRREAVAGTLFGLAAAMKCTALLWLPYLCWRAQGRGAVALIGVGLGVSLLADLWVKPNSGTWLEQYAHRVSSARTLGVWGTDPIYNQSLAGTLLRWSTVHVQSQPGGGLRTHVCPETLDNFNCRQMLMPLIGCLIGVTLVCAGRPGVVTPEAMAWEGACVLLLALLLSPMSGPAHFGTQILAGFLLARCTGGTCLLALLVAVLSLLGAKDLVRATVYDYALYFGHWTIGCLLLLAGCWWGRYRIQGIPSTPVNEASLPGSAAA